MEPRQKLAQLMGVDPTDPTIAGMDDAAVQKMLANFSNPTFSDRYKACFADVPFNPAGPGATPPPNATPPAVNPVVDPNQIAMSAAFAPLMQRLNALEAANNDLRQQLFTGAGAGVVTMSEAHRRIDECVKAGKVGCTKAIADAYLKPTATALLNLAPDKMLFSEGDHKGKAQIAVFLADLEARPVDIMFSEQVNDATEPGKGSDGLPVLDAEDLEILKCSNVGRSAARFYQDKRAAAAA